MLRGLQGIFSKFNKFKQINFYFPLNQQKTLGEPFLGEQKLINSLKFT